MSAIIRRKLTSVFSFQKIKIISRIKVFCSFQTFVFRHCLCEFEITSDLKFCDYQKFLIFFFLTFCDHKHIFWLQKLIIFLLFSFSLIYFFFFILHFERHFKTYGCEIFYSGDPVTFFNSYSI